METTLDQHHSVPDKPSYDDVNTTAVYMVGIISAILTVVIIAVVQGFTYQMINRTTAKKDEKYHELWVAPVIQEQRQHLQGDEKGTIPIAEAMKLVVEEFGKNSGGSK